ncbi:MAG: hypothetical protein K6F53_07280 [Lachnospiraceae bacterium]|nr:hypothetical protein [Lachnospiraceae bacterium]
MGKKDHIAKQYLSKNEVFADAFNYFLYQGRQVLHPEDLEEKSPEELMVFSHNKKLFTDERMRDILKSCTIRTTQGAILILLGIEAQSKVHYTMPVRNLIYDAMNYIAQIERKRSEKAIKERFEGDLQDRFMKGEKILPVITLCICLDTKKWDAPKSLHEMLAHTDDDILDYVEDYKLNLISAADVEDFAKFSSKLGVVLEFIKYSTDKEKLYDIIERKEEYKKVDRDTVNMINTFTSARIPMKEQEDEIDMCVAIKEMIEDGRKEGWEAGRTEGWEAGRTEGANSVVSLIRKIRSGKSREELIAEGADEDTVDLAMEALK